ncbi:TetR family transcriptional regulator [Mycolicibacterium obuense]|uniref:TetR family transcriptional regulator n=1 Tax=Mycolicibacterium obuense TaxID=1807 RepID=A0A0M2K2Q1_9MYCO|nr:TetR family transcriptional regulator [Mycolicibacterium obuense]KKF01210.1 TetR family transcriptional regulator [Mycolicibacterium obuense]TDL03112.1 TetR family transcriptional regulator [Mycolicibacterium obuense]
MGDVRGEPVLGLRERKKRRTRATLIDSAVVLCDRQGFDGTTVDQIAASADVSPRTFSRYFATKDAIALALIDEVLDMVAAELITQPPEIGHFEALRRAYIGMAQNSKLAPAGALSSYRLMQILRITVSSGTLQQAAMEFRASPVDVAMAERMGLRVDDRRVRLMSAVFGGVLMTALQEVTRCSSSLAGVGVDDTIAAFESVCADFMDEFAGFGLAV